MAKYIFIKDWEENLKNGIRKPYSIPKGTIIEAEYLGNTGEGRADYAGGGLETIKYKSPVGDLMISNVPYSGPDYWFFKEYTPDRPMPVDEKPKDTGGTATTNGTQTTVGNTNTPPIPNKSTGIKKSTAYIGGTAIGAAIGYHLANKIIPDIKYNRAIGAVIGAALVITAFSFTNRLNHGQWYWFPQKAI